MTRRFSRGSWEAYLGRIWEAWAFGEERTEMAKRIAQASAVPYRNRGNRLEFCLITSTRRGRWGFPKGIIDPGETPEETALKESEEEAGIHGVVDEDPIGEYEYEKWGSTLDVTVFLMAVEDEDDDWEEAHLRDRMWADAKHARRLLRPQLRGVLEAALSRLDA